MSDTQAGVPERGVDRGVGDFDAMYLETPPWDIGRPQPVFVELADTGAIEGRVLDAGCGTGEHVLMLAERGFDVTGVDSAGLAIAHAQRKSAERGLRARLLVFDALRLADLGEEFDTVIDSGLFHVFDDERRAQYVEALAAVISRGGRYLMCCFSDRQPGEWGPRRVFQQEIRDVFAQGWRIVSITEAEFETNLDPPLADAWLSRITRI
jgi:cyclopropane fatty-acyl-phospholipid synthase-like methyltransferase